MPSYQKMALSANAGPAVGGGKDQASKPHSGALRNWPSLRLIRQPPTSSGVPAKWGFLYPQTVMGHDRWSRRCSTKPTKALPHVCINVRNRKEDQTGPQPRGVRNCSNGDRTERHNAYDDM